MHCCTAPWPLLLLPARAGPQTDVGRVVVGLLGDSDEFVGVSFMMLQLGWLGDRCTGSRGRRPVEVADRSVRRLPCADLARFCG